VTPVDVAAGILLDDDRVLVTLRRAQGHLGGLWEFPGGKREPSETMPEALVRELNEELGIDVAIGPRWGILQYRYPDREIRLHLYFARIVAGTPHPHEAEELRWVTPTELAGLPVPDADQPLVEDLVRCQRDGIPLRDARQPDPGIREETA
jgi:8-oxo-dGTP diphosphatase